MDKKQLVKKDNVLIESRCNLSLSQQKIILAVIAQIKREDDNFKEYFLSVKEFKELMGLKGQSIYTEVRQSARSLKAKVLIIPKGENKELITSWFSSIEVDYHGKIGFSFDTKLKPYLLQLKRQFTSYQLKNILTLNSKYSVRLYELLKQYQNIGCRHFELHELRDMLFIEANSYDVFGSFNSRVLKVAKSDINENTDITIDYKVIKNGKKVVSLDFIIRKKSLEQQELFQPEDNKPPQTIINLIPQEHRKPCEKLCQQIFTRDGTNGLKFYIGKCNARKQTPDGSYVGYLKTIFDLDLYADMKEALEAQATAEKEMQKMRQESLEARQKQKVQEQEKQATLKARHEALDHLQSEDPDRYAQLEQEAADALKLDLKKPGIGGRMKIKFQMFELMEKP